MAHIAALRHWHLCHRQPRKPPRMTVLSRSTRWTLEAMETLLAETRNGDKLRTQTQVQSAVTAVQQGRGTMLRSLLACETLITDLRSAFGERPARDGSLEIVASAATLDELRE